MPTTLGKVDLFNAALALLGCEPLADVNSADDPATVDCNRNWQITLSEVGRAAFWNCLMAAVNLSATPQTPIIPGPPVPASTPWAPATVYAAGAYVTYGGQLYQALIANTSTASFVNDLTAGFWFQTDVFNADPFDPGQLAAQYPSGWAYQYPLPGDCLIVATLNDNPLTGPVEEWEVIGINLYTNEDHAVIKYVQYNEDTTVYDAMLANCLTLKLAARIATRRRQDDVNIAAALEAKYQDALHKARQKNAGERTVRRFEPAVNSRFITSRRWSTNS